MAAHSLTLLLAEITGLASVCRQVGEAEAAHALERCGNRLQRALQAGGGRPLSTSASRLVAVLPSAEAACNTARDMQQRIAALPPVGGRRLALRCAIHAAVPGSAVDEPDPLALADGERMLALAGAGDTVISTLILLHLPERPSVEAGAVEWETLNSDDLPGLVLYRGRQFSADPAPLAPPPAASREADQAPTAVSSSPATTSDSSRRFFASTTLAGLVWPERGVAQATTTPVGNEDRLCLRHGEQHHVVDPARPRLSLGRDPGCMLVIGDHRVSRQHAWIERRGRNYYLIDCSTNGSFVRVEGGREMLLRHGELMLAGSGSICLGASANDPTAACIDFAHID